MRSRNRSQWCFAAIAVTAAMVTSAGADTVQKHCEAHGGGDTRAVVVAADAFRKGLSADERARLEKPLVRANAIHWSNLPVGVVPRDGLRLGDLDTAKATAARDMLAAALSACGLTMLDEIRKADDALIPVDTRKVGWDGRNYYLTLLGSPSNDASWMLQVGGHHLAYNLTFNGRLPGATPLFFGTEPIRFTLQGKDYEPLRAQSAAMSQLAVAIAGHTDAKLSGTFTDVVKGVVFEFVPGKPPVGGTDTGYPHDYPSGTTDRGVRYDRLAPDGQARVREAIDSYTALPGEAITHGLVAAYLSPAALAETYIGYAGATDFSKEGSYVRIDGPRIWMELIVQRAVANQKELHYHALWRDKLADYGGEVGK
jgi:Protein of unknown function (DUF3500)